jgi:hypothetical protein
MIYVYSALTGSKTLYMALYIGISGLTARKAQLVQLTIRGDGKTPHGLKFHLIPNRGCILLSILFRDMYNTIQEQILDILPDSH